MAYTKRKFVSTPIGVHERERLGTSLAHMKQMLFGHRLAESQSLFKRDLRGHFGCVNAIEFSSDGEFIASGGDDRRLLLWNIGQAIFDDKAPVVIDTLHISNINTCCFDADNRKVSTGGNDGQVIVHDFNVRQSTAVYGLSDAVYCLSPDPVNATIIATATDDGKAQILDLRMSIDTSPFLLADLDTAMHSIMYNPAEPRLLATANSKHGVGLWDIRMPLKCLHYKSSVQNCMSVRFNSRGDKLLALRRRSSPVLYDIGKVHPIFEFDYKTYYNACTLKSCSFAGLNDEFVMSGSDDFCIYLWKVPTDISENYIQSEPHMILKGHRSIVNQVRYCPDNQVIISSGVEKLIKMWSPYYIPGCTGRLLHSRRYGDDEEVERNAYSHEEYIHMVLEAGSFLSHDYTNGTTEEEPCMIAFFDSLIQREIEQNFLAEEYELEGRGYSSDDSSSSDDDDNEDDDDSGGEGGGGRSGMTTGLSDSATSQQHSNGAGPVANDGEDAGSTRDTSVSSSSRLEDSSRPFYMDLESSSDSEGEVDVILSAMYSRYMTARERAMNSGFKPSGKKISSVIAKGKQKDSTLRKKMRFRKHQGVHKNPQHNSDPFIREDTSNMNILADVIDNFVDNLVARESSNGHVLSDTNDGHLSTDSGSNNLRENSTTPVEVVQQTITLHTDCTSSGSPSTASQSFSRRSAVADSPHDELINLESGMYFMPELQVFAPKSFSAVTNFNQSPGPSWSDNVNRTDIMPISDLIDEHNCLTSNPSRDRNSCESGNSSVLSETTNNSFSKSSSIIHNSSDSSTSPFDSLTLHPIHLERSSSTATRQMLPGKRSGYTGINYRDSSSTSATRKMLPDKRSADTGSNYRDSSGTSATWKMLPDKRSADTGSNYRDSSGTSATRKMLPDKRSADTDNNYRDSSSASATRRMLPDKRSADTDSNYRESSSASATRRMLPDKRSADTDSNYRESSSASATRRMLPDKRSADTGSNYRESSSTSATRRMLPGKRSADTDSHYQDKNNQCVVVPSTRDGLVAKRDPVLKRAFTKCNLSSNSSSSSVSTVSSCHDLSSASTSSSVGVLIGDDSDLDGFKPDTRPNRITTNLDNHKPASVQFKKAKVAGKRFRVRRSESRSSSDEGK